MARQTRAEYGAHFGPTVGDRMRLADTELMPRSNATITSMAKKRGSAVAKSFATGWGRAARAPCRTW
jgi:urease alpha subunit